MSGVPDGKRVAMLRCFVRYISRIWCADLMKASETADAAWDEYSVLFNMEGTLGMGRDNICGAKELFCTGEG